MKGRSTCTHIASTCIASSHTDVSVIDVTCSPCVGAHCLVPSTDRQLIKDIVITSTLSVSPAYSESPQLIQYCLQRASTPPLHRKGNMATKYLWWSSCSRPWSSHPHRRDRWVGGNRRLPSDWPASAAQCHWGIQRHCRRKPHAIVRKSSTMSVTASSYSIRTYMY